MVGVEIDSTTARIAKLIVDISLYFVSSHGQNRSFMNAPCTPVNDDLHRRQELPLHHLQ